MKALSRETKIAGLVIAMFLTIFAIISFSQEKIADAFGAKYQPNLDNATTTTTFMSSAGTTYSPVFNTDGGESLSLYLMLGSSTTPPTLSYRIQYSPFVGTDCVTTPSACDWYDEDVALAANSTTTPHVRDGALNTWAYASTTSNQTVISGANSVKFITKRVDILNLNSTFTRVVFSGAGAHSLLHVRPSLKNTYILPK